MAFLENMITLYSDGALKVKSNKYKAAKNSFTVVAAKDIAEGTRFLTAPAGIVRGSPNLKTIIMSLLGVLRSVPGLTEMPRGTLLTPLELDEFQDLVPVEVLALAKMVHENAIILTNGFRRSADPTFAVSVPFSLLPHQCSGNAVGVVGTFPVHDIVDGSVEEREACVLYAFKDIRKGDEIKTTYGFCNADTPDGFACTLEALTCENSVDLSHMMSFIEAEKRFWRPQHLRSPNVYTAPWGLSDVFQEVLGATINLVAKDPVTEADVSMLAAMYFQNRGRGDKLAEMSHNRRAARWETGDTHTPGSRRRRGPA
jgi:hypothetical protein